MTREKHNTKIVHSFWTLPSRLKGYNKYEGGWVEKKYNYMSWALSCLQFSQFYNEVEIVTDTYGARLLADLLQLPYTTVKVELDRLNDYHPNLWALGKTIAYGMQDTPFIHADGDIFIYDYLPDRVEQAPLVAQHLEVDFSYYYPIANHLIKEFEYVPEYILKDREENKIIRSYSAGLMGGQDTAFMKEYSEEVFSFIDRNQTSLEKVHVHSLNVIFDQYLFYCLTQDRDREVTCYTGNVNRQFDGFTDFSGIPGRSAYLHPLDVFKKNPANCEQIAYRLRRDYPQYYYRIIQLLRDQII
ncbi:MAG: DUF6734 family protein [Cyclobacteriaceae bacterium]